MWSNYLSLSSPQPIPKQKKLSTKFSNLVTKAHIDTLPVWVRLTWYGHTNTWYTITVGKSCIMSLNQAYQAPIPYRYSTRIAWYMHIGQYKSVLKTFLSTIKATNRFVSVCVGSCPAICIIITCVGIDLESNLQYQIHIHSWTYNNCAPISFQVFVWLLRAQRETDGHSPRF